MKVKSHVIEAILADRGITKKSLAEEIGISAQSISTIIRRGTCEPKTAGRLAKGLNVSVFEIMESEV